jgi:cell division protein FtsB
MIGRLAIGAVVLSVVLYALQGGEYGTTDLVRQRARRRAMMAEIDSLQQEVDSLGRLKKRLETDPVLQERIAREEFGMVRGDKELLYRFADPADSTDSAASKGATRRP